jgi:hypothetical protein
MVVGKQKGRPRKHKPGELEDLFLRMPKETMTWLRKNHRGGIATFLADLVEKQKQKANQEA